MRLGTPCALTAVAALAFTAAAPASATEPDIVFDPGWACEFGLGVTISDSGHRPFHEFYDKDGNLIKTIEAGKGSDLLFTNMDSGATFATKGNGAVDRTLYDGNRATSVLTGHWIWIAYPTDTPPGPSTTLYVGRVTLIDGVLDSTSGRSVDICAALS